MAKKRYASSPSTERKPVVKKEPLTEAEAYPRLLRYCAFQERGPAEVETKMRGFGLDAGARERLIERLKEENYLSLDRFAETFAGGKLRSNKWGTRKIAMGLAAKGVDKDTIAEKLGEIPQDDFRKTLRTLLEKRDESQYKHLPPAERRQKLFRLGLSRGFATDLVSEEVKRVMGGAMPDEEGFDS